MPRIKRGFLPLPDAAGAVAAALIEREELLTAEARRLTATSHRRRSEVDGQLAELNRLLVALGLRGDV